MGTFLLCKRFVTDGHCPEAEFMIATQHLNHRFLNVLLLIVTFEAPALYSVRDGPSAILSKGEKNTLDFTAVCLSPTPPDRCKIVFTDRYF